jgi:DNA-binding NarL/FixJ family response regulator
MIDVVMEYCRTQRLLDQLLAEIKTANPRQYVHFERHRYSQSDQAPVPLPISTGQMQLPEARKAVVTVRDDVESACEQTRKTLKNRVLIVDDSAMWRDLFRECFEGLPSADLEIVGTYKEADDLLDRKHFHLAVVDLALQERERELQGLKLARKIAELNEGTRTIIISGYADATIATEVLTSRHAFYLVEKEKFDSKRLIELAQHGIAQASRDYEIKFMSAIEFLRGHEAKNPWVANVLRAVLGTDTTPVWSGIASLRDFLNALLAGSYPLLHHRGDKGSIIDSKAGVVTTLCWSKAWGEPILVRFGKHEFMSQELKEVEDLPQLLIQRGFEEVKRSLRTQEFSGAVYTYPQFEDFEGRRD